VQRTVKEHGAKLAEADRSKIEAALKEVQEAMKGDDTARIDQAVEALNQASYAIAQMLYQQKGGPAGAEPGAGPGAGPGPGPGAQAGTGPQGQARSGKGKDDDVIDAEYEVKE